MGGDGFGKFFDTDWAFGFVADAGDFDSIESTGGDREEAAEAFFGDVDGEAVHADPFAHADADGGEFAVFDPDTCEAIAALSWDAEVKAGIDEGLLDGADVGVEVFAQGAEVNDRIADELAWAVVGGLTATVDFYHGMRE